MEQPSADPAGDSIHLPYQHVSKKGGKNLRSKMTEAINAWFGCDQEWLKESKEMLQNACILVDDVEDNSMKRRGLPCAHRIYGIPATINSGNYYYFVGLRRIVSFKKKTHDEQLIPALLMFMENLMKIHIGQAMEMYYKDNLVCPTDEEYKNMADLKTTTFFHTLFLSCKLLSGIQLDLERLIYLIGQYFQIKDDYINLKCDTVSKLSLFWDISEGKVSFPIVHAINKCPNDKTIFNILKLKTQDVELKQLVIDYLEEAGSFRHTEKVLGDLAVEIKEELNKFDHNPSFKALVSTIFLETHRILIDDAEIADKLTLTELSFIIFNYYFYL